MHKVRIYNIVIPMYKEGDIKLSRSICGNINNDIVINLRINE